MRELHLIDRYCSRQTGPLTREEIDVQEALADCTTAGATEWDWTPLTDLYRVYVRWWLADRQQWAVGPAFPERYPQLTRRQFGRAVWRVFPAVRSRKRAWRGKRQWGFAGLRGRWSTVTPPARRKRESANTPR
jgi:hypothetical protein